ncbi:MAG: hypothetical protein OXQ31_26915 [Spirochaetaceae bacterium]|nr:hypothetical protein [Spirochaetaceae bacterium]
MADEGHRDEASPQEVWAILRELSASQRETDRHMQETDRRMQETDRLMRENARRIRELDELFNGQWGKLMEALVKGDLAALLNRRGIEVDLVFTNVERNYDGRRWEIDILAVNGAELVAVEVKTTLKVRDVNHYLNTLRHFTELIPEYAGRAVYGAVAYLKEDESSATYAERQGLFVIRATGSSASITNGKDFRPRTFGSQPALGGAR